jgi:PHD/YefM family antitoxin component YafN of YafNO toxin-antitoxin module
MPQSRVRFIGSRELHRDLPKVLDSLEDPSSRYVLTIHSKPRAVLIGTEAFLELLRGHTPADRLLAMQLGALVKGLHTASSPESEHSLELEAVPESETIAVTEKESENQLVSI